MELETAYIAPPTQAAYVLCADCGTAIEPNNSGLCVNCLRNTVDITDAIPKQANINYCRNCERYLSPPQTWVIAELESRELLAICLRKLRGLKTVRLIDAGFIWTESHSKRLRVKLTVQKEVLASTVLQQIFEVEYIVQYGQCPDCTQLAAKQHWKAVVQARQKVDHKKTFLFLEQLILKHGADKDTVSVKEVRDGLDFFYASKQAAAKMVEFLQAVAPVKMKQSEQLISQDTQNSTSNYKTTFSVEILPICKDDLVCLPLKVARSLSNIGQIVVCTRVGNSIHLIDPVTLHTADITAPVYFRAPFPPLAPLSGAVEFVVLDIEPTQHPPKVAGKGRFMLADAQVTPISGTMESDTIYHTRTHLGAVLKAGDTVMGYQLHSANFNNTAWDSLKTDRIPEVILVRKTYPNRAKKSKGRKWRLRSMAKEAGEDGIGLGRERAVKAGRMPGHAEQARAEADYEAFLRDIEEDEEMRQGVNLYKKPKPQAAVDTMDVESVADTEADDDFPRIDMDELLDDMDGLQLTEDDAGEEISPEN
ncbi:uncharacterized protein L969DRAFT_99961 [Mixia osmundae IAM 14324]|uniref:60S ribosomal export protein NMD3 n=1 Tax=Mixia osmundae (strain CBS 9802 / IAM 14324 / JCM 22182 / KY 12970) TaxID=764103 RepID=G7EAZ8_MIXOS|nr:uncharacterized protein L969DRAFT_99961 [Mixia osmundae IAM 14324]KEI37043.1 hypothetical protein L969DRAFT_99961 [Mixia osmundae IAM 14324]GAB00009.1 hypothetical protein E5Q_06711 [Mixia osmundae IAM 14324]